MESKKDNWLTRVFRKRVKIMTGYDRRTKQHFIWSEIGPRDVKEIQDEMYRRKPRYKDLTIEYDQTQRDDFN